MARVTLELLKQHVRSDEFADDDAYLAHVLDVAEAQVVGMTGYTEAELAGIADEDFPAPLRHAILMRAASLYNFREDVDSGSLSQLPGALLALVKPYQRGNGGSLMEPLINS